MQKLGNLIKTKRKLENLSLREFADRCKLSHSYIKNLEEADPRTGKEVIPTIDSLEKIAPALCLTLEDLLREVGYISDVKKFEPSNLELIRDNRSYIEISRDIELKTGNKIDPSLYESIEQGKNESPSILFIDTLAKYANVDRSFFYKKNTLSVLHYAREKSPYQQLTHGNRELYFSSEPELLNFVRDLSNKEYLLLAKELKDKKIKVKFVRDTFFYE